jgi:hypothetical protein
MGHGIDFGEELAVNHRQIREAAAAAPAELDRLCSVLQRHARLLRQHILPTVARCVRGGTQVAASDEAVLGWIEREISEKRMWGRRHQQGFRLSGDQLPLSTPHGKLLSRPKDTPLPAQGDQPSEQEECRIRNVGVLLDLVEVQLDWEERVLLPLLEAETTWMVLEDLADHTRLARQR